MNPNHGGLTYKNYAESRYIEYTKGGLFIWANARFSLDISTEPHANQTIIWGRVTALSSFGLSPGHHLLWNAVRKWRNDQNNATAQPARKEKYIAETLLMPLHDPRKLKKNNDRRFFNQSSKNRK